MRFILAGDQFSGVPVRFGLDKITSENCRFETGCFLGLMMMPSLVCSNVTTSPRASLSSDGIEIRPFESSLTCTGSIISHRLFVGRTFKLSHEFRRESTTTSERVKLLAMHGSKPLNLASAAS